MRDEQKIFKVLEQFRDEAIKLGLIPYAVMLKGSQNYNLDDEESDIDANMIFIPTPSQLRKDIKHKIELPEGECTCHNIYSFAEIVAKGNPQWIEVCHTKYAIGKSLEMFKHYKVNPSALKGMVMEKVNAFDKLYPSRAHMIEKFGYDPKQLHHIIRLYDLLNHDVPIFEYSPLDRKEMIDIKRGFLDKEEATKVMNRYLTALEQIYNEKKISYEPQPVDYDLIDKIVLETYRDLIRL